MAKDTTLRCSMCNREKKEVKILIAGVNGHICENCVSQAYNLIKEESSGNQKQQLQTSLNLLKPAVIKKGLDDYVIGQDEAKKVLSVAVYNHFKRINHSAQNLNGDIEIDKSNLILVGETGTGKTLLARTIAKMLNVPFCIADATIFTEAGYVGEDVESVITRLLQAADYDVAAAERGIVFIDEIDKISRKGDNPSITRDLKEGTQHAFLKLLEGTVANVPPQGGRKHPDAKMIQVNTKNILFICGGAFEGIEKKIANRLNTQAVGYSASVNEEQIDKANLLQYISPQDLKSYGLIPELIGRLPVLTYLKPLDRDVLRNILTEPKNAIIKQYIHLFKLDGCTLDFEPQVYDLIIDKAIEFKLGARGLRSICEAIMLDSMFEIPTSDKKKQFTVTYEYALSKLNKAKISQLHVA
ncbi:MAG: ATP-dependent Clp protease ATP-binding subunit ClpX [Bacteroidetes bacterium]|nr:ATP-dependent Clp protease ATP-binding subunit ClpX [Bacteroidota bacterium]MCA6445056.1 ATP-dependent Clp protease ATP-binding subunit ClpX [Bacteroidota bacterium]